MNECRFSVFHAIDAMNDQNAPVNLEMKANCAPEKRVNYGMKKHAYERIEFSHNISFDATYL